MPVENYIRESLRQAVSKRLAPLLSQCHRSDLFGSDTIQLIIKEREDSTSEAAVLRLNVMDRSREVQIPTIFFPPSWRGNRIGMALIADIFRVCERYGYRLFIVQMVESFYRYMQGFGVRKIDHDTVEILGSTRLRPCGIDKPCEKIEPDVTPDPLCVDLDDLVEALQSGDDAKYRSIAFAQVEKGGVVNIMNDGEIVDKIETFEQIGGIWGW
jgi:hypothetical protein